MLAGIVGDVIGSVYEAHQWLQRDLDLLQPLPIKDSEVVKPLFKNLKWVRKSFGWTDDTLCTLALYSAYVLNEDPVKALQDFCTRYGNEDIGFGKSFEAWLQNPVPYESYGNGAVMRLGFIPFLNIDLNKKLDLARSYTEISHNHPDSFAAVAAFILLSDKMQKTKSKECLKEFLKDHKFLKTVEQMHEEKIFELNALQTLLQAAVAVVEASNMQEVLKNTFYIGGDSDTLGCIAANLASNIYTVPNQLWAVALSALEPHRELMNLVNNYKKKYVPQMIEV